MIIDTLTDYKGNYVVLPITKDLLNHVLISHHQDTRGSGYSQDTRGSEYSHVFAYHDVPDYVEKELEPTHRDNKLDYREVDEVMTCPLVESDGSWGVVPVSECFKEVPETQVAKGYYKKGNYLKPLTDRFARRDKNRKPSNPSDAIDDLIVEFVRDDEDNIIYRSHQLIAHPTIHEDARFGRDRPEVESRFIEVPKFQKGAPTVVASNRKKDGKYSRQANTPFHVTQFSGDIDSLSKSESESIKKRRENMESGWNPNVVTGSTGVSFKRAEKSPYIGLVKTVTVPGYTLPGGKSKHLKVPDISDPRIDKGSATLPKGWGSLPDTINRIKPAGRMCFCCGNEDVDTENNNRCNSCGNEDLPK